MKSTYPSWRRCWRSSCLREANFGPNKTNWMASKKLLFPLPFLPTITLCFGLKGSISLWLRNDLNPDIITCLICIAKTAKYRRKEQQSKESLLKIELFKQSLVVARTWSATTFNYAYHRWWSKRCETYSTQNSPLARQQNSNIFLNFFGTWDPFISSTSQSPVRNHSSRSHRIHHYLMVN